MPDKTGLGMDYGTVSLLEIRDIDILTARQ
jgi:hypothetical protein